MTKCFFGVDDQGGFPAISAVASKSGEYLNRVGLSRRHILEAVDASVERLGTYIDVLQIHRLDRETPREEIMRALNDVVESGKVRYIGASSVCSPLTVSIVCTNRILFFFVFQRWLLGNSNRCKTSLSAMAGTSSFRCKTTTI